MSGHGNIYYPGNRVYDGNLEWDEPNGKGKLTTPKFEYNGEFVNGQFDGKGMYSDHNGIIYDGYFRNNKRNGNGKEFTADGKFYKIGTWENDNPKSVRIESSLKIDTIETYNAAEGGKIIGEKTNTFTQEDIRYVHWATNVRNEGPKAIKGFIAVRFTNPDGSISYAAEGADRNAGISYYHELSQLRPGERQQETHGYGQNYPTFDKGAYKIELFFEGAKLGEAMFYVR